jgi:tetratricopeptide (TPR) repeat protein
VSTQAPEIPEEVEFDPFKRRVALLVVAITFFGSLVAFLQTRAGNREEIAAREAQIEAVSEVGTSVSSQAEQDQAYDVYVLASEYERRTILAKGRARVLGETPAGAAAAEEAARWERARVALSPLSPLLGDERYAIEPVAESPYFAEKSTAIDTASLRQQARSEVVGAWGSKSGSYIAVITLLAVALFLLGLSLTIGGEVRKFLTIPAVGIFAVCLVGTGLIVVRRIPDTPDEAIEAVATGNALFGQKKYAEAIDAYTRAIRSRDDYAVAYLNRGTAHFFEGATLVGERFANTTQPENLQASIADMERAVDFGAKDTLIFNNLGYSYFLAGRYDDAVDFFEQGLALNSNLSHIWTNLSGAEAALGDEEAARSHLDHAIEIALDGPSYEHYDSFSFMRNTFEVLEAIKPDSQPIAERLRGHITLAQGKSEIGKEADPGSEAAVEVTDFEVEGAEFTAEFDFTGMTEGSLYSEIWLYRPGPDVPWGHDPTFFSYFYDNFYDGDGSGETTNSRACPKPGEYRIDFYENGERVGSTTQEVSPGVLGDPVQFQEEVLGISVCRPTDWTVDEQEAFVLFSSPDDRLSFGVGTQPVDPLALSSPSEVEQGIIRASSQGNPPRDGAEVFEPIDFGGVSGQVAYYTAEAGGDPATMAVLASLGEDAVLRFVVAVAPDEEIETLNELLLTVRFTDAPEAQQ